jgi:hypothetical protein
MEIPAELVRLGDYRRKLSIRRAQSRRGAKTAFANLSSSCTGFNRAPRSQSQGGLIAGSWLAQATRSDFAYRSETAS